MVMNMPLAYCGYVNALKFLRMNKYQLTYVLKALRIADLGSRSIQGPYTIPFKAYNLYLR
jgi:hypothetical protein